MKGRLLLVLSSIALLTACGGPSSAPSTTASIKSAASTAGEVSQPAPAAAAIKPSSNASASVAAKGTAVIQGYSQIAADQNRFSEAEADLAEAYTRNIGAEVLCRYTLPDGLGTRTLVQMHGSSSRSKRLVR